MEQLFMKQDNFSFNSCDYETNSGEFWLKQTSNIYDVLKFDEVELNTFVHKKNKPLKKLYIKNVDKDQIHHQVELQTKPLLNKNNLYPSLNLYYKVGKANIIEENELSEASDEDELSGASDQDELSGSSDQDELSGPLDEDELSGSSDLEELSDHDPENDLEEDGFSDEEDDTFKNIDFDKDTFADIALEGDETDSEEDDEKIESGESENDDDSENRKFKPSLVDSKFLNLRESEWIADNDVIGKSFGDEIDLMQDLDSDDEDNKAMYDAFFDPVDKKKSKKYQSDEPDTHIDDEQDNDDGVEEEENNKDDEEESQDDPKKPISRFQAELMEEDNLLNAVEDENYILEKPWAHQGETTKTQRPVNSILEEALDYNVASSRKPDITEDLSLQIERLVLSRIKTRSWDDVERKIRPSTNPYQYKQKLVLDEEKSKKSLAQIYEEEFLKNQKPENTGGNSMILGTKDAEEELPVHQEIKQDLLKIFACIEPLTNYHYAPKQKSADIKIVNNRSAITLEEATPMTATDATLLAPQEIIAPLKGNLKAESEKTTSDKKRERRSKKLLQKKKAQYQEEKLKINSQKTDKHGFMHKDASKSLVQRALKSGQIKALEVDDDRAKSSKQFFEKFSATKRKEVDRSNVQVSAKKRKKGAGLKDCSSISKVLL